MADINGAVNPTTDVRLEERDALVSIVIPCYSGERYLTEAIESCRVQTYPSLEIIVVDDASPDRCRSIAEEYAAVDPRVRVVLHAKNGGVARAFNSGFEAARGMYLTRLAQDDVFEPHAVEQMVRALQESGTNVGLVYCDYLAFDESGSVSWSVCPPKPVHVLKYRNGVGLCTMWTRDVWKSVGKFDPECDAAEDYDYWLRVSAGFQLTKSDGPAALRVRIHSEMGSVRYAERQVRSTFRAIRKAYGRRLSISSGCLRRQMALGSARITSAHVLKDQERYGAAFLELILSMVEWPWPLPAAVYATRFLRPRALLGVTRQMLSNK